jgi:hypothetical protein
MNNDGSPGGRLPRAMAVHATLLTKTSRVSVARQYNSGMADAHQRSCEMRLPRAWRS